MLYPEPVKFRRSRPLDPARFQYLEGCVRQDADYSMPEFAANQDKPVVYVSFGSLGSGDTELLKRIIEVMAKMPCRALVNVGDYKDEYDAPPPNVIIDSWFPQPSVIPQVDAVVHHGGNNTFTECLYFGKPALILPYVWDGHDNATRVQETGHGLKMHRYDKLAATSRHMQAADGRHKAARLLDDLLKRQA